MEDTDAEASCCEGVVCYLQFALDEMSQQFSGNYSSLVCYMMHLFCIKMTSCVLFVFNNQGCIGECSFRGFGPHPTYFF